MFTSVVAESAWQWAKGRRQLFKTPLVATITAVTGSAATAGFKYLSGDPAWLGATVAGLSAALFTAWGLPFGETAYWWWNRDRILVEEELASLKAAAAASADSAVGPIPEKPLALPILFANRTGWARLRVTNEGAGAVFSATVQTHNLTAGAVEGRLVPAKWQEVETPTQRIARGDSRVLILATLTNLGAPGVHGWKIHRADGPDLGGIDPEDVIDVTVVAEPDLAEPCQLRVVLRADPSKSELVRLPIEAAPMEPATVGSPPIRLVLPEIIQKNLSDYPVRVELLVNGRKAWVQIDSAVYGCDGSVRDVREEVLDQISDGRIDLVVDNRTLGGDPYKGEPKELIVTYSVSDGPPITVRKKEHERLRIP